MTARRHFLIVLSAGALAAPLASFAQPKGKVWRIGFLSDRDPSSFGPQLEVFKTGMQKLGYAEGRDYTTEVRVADGNLSRFPALVAELLELKVDVMVIGSTSAVAAAQKATREIPIILYGTGDPVGTGFVASLRRPGGNITGLTNSTVEILPKRVELIREILPAVQRVGFIYSPGNPAAVLGSKNFESACVKLGLTPLLAQLHKFEDIVLAYDRLVKEKVQALLISADVSSITWQRIVLEESAKTRLPTVVGPASFAELGGLASYFADQNDLVRRSAGYVDKIFKGANPGDLPIEQPNKFDMVINLKTAKALGITIPQSILVRADRVIE